VIGLWLVVSGLGFWLWGLAFDQELPGKWFLFCFEALGSLIVMPLAKFVPLAPLKGDDPEVLAADEFFKGPKR
jgi:hypothetical protein